MALYGVSFTISYVAWDTSANEGKTDDVGSHTLRWIKDGTSGAPSNSPAEVDATNAPGVYKLVLTAAEAEAVYGTLCGKSSTGNVSIMPASLSFEKLPNVVAGGDGGLPLGDANGRVDVSKLGGVVQSLADLKDFADAGYDPDTNKVQGVVLVDTTTTNSDMVSLSTLESRLTAARGNLLDNIPAGTMPTQAEVLSIQNNTRTTIGIPTVAERPDAGSTRLKIYLNNYDTVGNMEVPDSAPTVAVVNEEGSARSGNLQHPTTHGAQTTMVNLSAGRYWIEYDLDNADSLESLTFTFSIIEGGATRVIDRVMLIVDTTAVDFTASDRTLLQDIPSTAEFEARTILAASYFDPASDDVTTDGASRTASKADVSALATTTALTTVGNNVVLVLVDTGLIGQAFEEV